MFNSLPEEVRKLTQECARSHFDEEVVAVYTVGGGCINKAMRVQCQNSTFFLKWNDKTRFPGMFDAEKNGLGALRNSQGLFVPKVIDVIETNTVAAIALEWVNEGQRRDGFWEIFASGLARVHRCSASAYGFDGDNFIGSLPQGNNWRDTWLEFFVEERIMPQYELAFQHGYGKSMRHNFERLYKELEGIFPPEKPALLHGDLWSGNFVVTEDGEPGLIDPAVYYGHREVDLAFTQLFGGFGVEFYQFYDDQFPIQEGFQSRVDIYNLYPLLVHVNLFGGGYWSQVESIVSKF